MNKQILGCMIAAAMSAGVGCASQATEGQQTVEERTAALKLEGATDITQRATESGTWLCYYPKTCAKNAEFFSFICCVDLETGIEDCNGKDVQFSR